MGTNRIIICLITSFIFLFANSGYCDNKNPDPKVKTIDELKEETKISEEDLAKVVMKVNGKEIYGRALLTVINSMLPDVVIHGKIKARRQQPLRQDALNKLIANELTNQEFKKWQENASQVEKNEIANGINEYITEVRKKNKKKKITLEEQLKKDNLTLEMMENILGKNVFIRRRDEKLKTKVTEKLTDAYLEEYYNNNKNKFMTPEVIRLRQILIKVIPGSEQAIWHDAGMRVENIMEEIDSGKKTFEQAAMEYSEDYSASQGGDMGFQVKGSLAPPEVADIASHMIIGQIAGPVWSIYGYHILKLEEIIFPMQIKFDKVNHDIKNELLETEFENKKKEWIEELRKKSNIEFLNEKDRKLMEQDIEEKTKDEKDK